MIRVEGDVANKKVVVLGFDGAGTVLQSFKGDGIHTLCLDDDHPLTGEVGLAFCHLHLFPATQKV